MKIGGTYRRRYGRRDTAKLVSVDLDKETVVLDGLHSITGSGREERVDGEYTIGLSYFLSGFKEEKNEV